MKIFTVVLFALMVVAQWFVPVSMIYDTESIRTNGKLFRFETKPVDPTDPFRGKYITLHYVLATYETNTTTWDIGADVYVMVQNDDKGISQIKAISKTRPADNEDYFKATVDYINSGTRLNLTFPFERFYLEESKASSAETIYNQNNRDSERNRAYAEVYIYKGKAYLDDVKINGKSIVAIVKEANAKNTGL